jgi:hypothetical protein
MFRTTLITLATLAAPVTIAHHATTVAYDTENLGTIEGEVVSVFWRNPHVLLTVERVSASGIVETWTAESGSPNSLARAGYNSDIVAIGDRVTLLGALSRSGMPAMAAYTMTLADGTEIPLWPQRALAIGRDVPPAPFSNAAVAAGEREADGIFRVWSAEQVREEPHLPFTEFALNARSGWDPLTDDPALRCEPPGMPAMMFSPYPIQFVDQGDTLLLRLEEWDGRRTIHMQSDADPAQQPASHYGFSTGEWEGNTLIVRTTQVSAPYFDDLGTPFSPSAQIIERFTLSADERRLDYETRVVDPRIFDGTATMRESFVWTPGEQIRPFNCSLPENPEN